MTASLHAPLSSSIKQLCIENKILDCGEPVSQFCARFHIFASMVSMPENNRLIASHTQEFWNGHRSTMRPPEENSLGDRNKSSRQDIAFCSLFYFGSAALCSLEVFLLSWMMIRSWSVITREPQTNFLPNSNRLPKNCLKVHSC